MKKLINLILVVVLTFSLMACGSNPSTPTEGNTPDPTKAPAAQTTVADEKEEIVLDFPSWQAAEAGFTDFWVDIIARYEADHPGVKINLYQVPYAGYIDTLVTRFSGGNAPDICHIPTANFYALYKEGWLDNLDARFEGTDIVETWTPLQSSVCGEDGGNYGLLLMGYAQVLYYNEKLLNEAGVAVPTTMDEFVEAARKLTKDTDNDGVTDQFGYTSPSASDASLNSAVAPFVVGNGTHWATGDQINVDDPKVMEGLEAFKTLYQEGLMPIGLNVEQARSYFLEGKAAMYMGGSFFWAAANGAPEGVVEHLRIAPTPTVDAIGQPSNSLHIPASIDEERKELVWDFIELASSDEYQRKYAEYTQNPPPKSTAMTDELIASNPAVAMFAEQAARAKDERVEAFIPVNTEFNKLMVDEILAYCMDPDMTAEECLENIDDAVKNDLVR